MMPAVTMNKKVNKKSDFVMRLLNGANCFYDRIFRALYVTLLFALDFIMFIYSINGKLLEDGAPNEAVLWIVGGVFGAVLVLMFLLSFSGLAQNILCAVLTMVLTLAFFNQFALFNVDTFIETWLREHASALTFIGIVPSAVLVALIFGCIIFFAFCYTFPIILFCFALAASIIAGVVSSEFNSKLPSGEYVVTKDFNNAAADKNGNSLIYFMLPRFPSYHFLSTVKDINFRELRDLMIGFYAVNDFEIYPNAFVQKNNTVSNIVDIYNQVDYTSTKSGIRGYAEILNDWDFVHGQLNLFGLEDNVLYQDLKKSGYRVSTYPMPDFNFCYNKDKMDTDRCVEKAYKTVSLYDKKNTLEKNIYALLGEWFLSLNSRDLNSVAKMLIDSSSLRGLKVISQNRRVSEEGSAALFDQIGGDFTKDGSGVAYMAYVDLPSDIYIYDEFCNIKPRKEWVAMKDHALTRGGIDAKRQAYADQAKCAVGLLQMFMEDFLQDEKSGKTDVIVQGLSTIKEFSGMSAGQYENFVSDKLVSLGIRKAQSPAFLINTKVCLASDITKSLITGKEVCYSLEHMKMSTNEMFNLQQNLLNNAVIRGGRIINIAENYRDWYEEFKNNSPFYKAKRERVIEERVRREMQLEAEARRAYLNGLQKQVSDAEALPQPSNGETVSQDMPAAVENETSVGTPAADSPANIEIVSEVSDSAAPVITRASENDESVSADVSKEDDAQAVTEVADSKRDDTKPENEVVSGEAATEEEPGAYNPAEVAGEAEIQPANEGGSTTVNAGAAVEIPSAIVDLIADPAQNETMREEAVGTAENVLEKDAESANNTSNEIIDSGALPVLPAIGAEAAVEADTSVVEAVKTDVDADNIVEAQQESVE